VQGALRDAERFSQTCFPRAGLIRWSPVSQWLMCIKDHQGTLHTGKRLHNYGKSPFSMGKSTISMAIFAILI
jgi:hypothetical protein